MTRSSRPPRRPGLPRTGAFIVVLLLIALAWWLQAGPRLASTTDTSLQGPVQSAETSRAQALPTFLPREARATLALIASGGPFPHPQDDQAFGNREARLPRQPRGYYREYTVETPGLSHRGARRIVTGGQPPRSYYYTDDHYASFTPFEVAR